MNHDLLEANGIIQQMITAINSGNPLRINVAVERAQEYMSRPTPRALDAGTELLDPEDFIDGHDDPRYGGF